MVNILSQHPLLFPWLCQVEIKSLQTGILYWSLWFPHKQHPLCSYIKTIAYNIKHGLFIVNLPNKLLTTMGYQLINLYLIPKYLLLGSLIFIFTIEAVSSCKMPHNGICLDQILAINFEKRHLSKCQSWKNEKKNISHFWPKNILKLTEQMNV